MELALKLPWTNTANITINSTKTPTESMFPAASTDLGTVITSFGNAAIYVGAFLMFFWMAWGVFDYLRAEGNKEALAKARKRIQWAIAGFIILLIAFYMSDFLQDALLKNPSIWQRGGQRVQNLTKP